MAAPDYQHRRFRHRIRFPVVFCGYTLEQVGCCSDSSKHWFGCFYHLELDHTHSRERLKENGNGSENVAAAPEVKDVEITAFEVSAANHHHSRMRHRLTNFQSE